MTKQKFLRRTWSRFSKLGKRRKKLQKWRRPTGRDNKMREKRKGYPAVVSIGHKQDSITRGKISDKKPVMIMNLKDLEKIGKNQIGVIGSVGKKRKLEIAKVAKEKKIELLNMNVKKILKKHERNKKQKKKKEEIKKVIKKKDSKSKTEEVKNEPAK